ncbi:adenylylsulfate kinase [Thermonema lapsum]|uniref:Adenylyl-sulfate kinase n=1 Tax=Thermonema lapsum TaxID=28195 RepID=A0A846MTN7_9BACT|nr:adenylyl-sulfate kinase [Thermonema lapsum]NIK74692.1 adenylylsulfate kinase [Thermonema lapsum]
MKPRNIKWHQGRISLEDRHRRNKHKSGVIWLTGLPASGKSTLAYELEHRLFHAGMQVYVLDGDNIRHGLNRDLGFSAEDRRENLRRIAEVAKLFVEAGVITIAAFVSPYEQDRQDVRAIFDEDLYIEVYVKCPLEVCEQRDPKGLYEKARRQEIAHFTGVSAPYEPPSNPDLIIETHELSVEEGVNLILQEIKKRKWVDYIP